MKNLGLIWAITGLCLLAACGGGGTPITTTQHLVITSAPPTLGALDTYYRGFTPTASGGTPPYNWDWAAATGSALPGGLYMANTGIYGTPLLAGTYNVVITVRDSASPPNQSSAPYSIQIVDLGSPLIVPFPPPPAAAVTLPYSFRFTLLGRQLPVTWSETGSLPPGLLLSDPDQWGGMLSGTPTASGKFPISVMATDAGGRSAAPQNFTIVVAEHGFEVTGKTAVLRHFHDATLLQDGRVLVTGGTDLYGTSLSSAELYDPTGRTFSAAAPMAGARGCHAGTQLKDGRVLISGGYDSTGSGSLATAELFSPATATFAITGNMAETRACPTATLLKDGRVLVIGGFDSSGSVSATAELFDPTSGTFSSASSMTTARAFHSATLLSDGRVLVAGGIDTFSADLLNTAIHPISSAEVFDPATNSFSATNGMAWTRFSHTATLLSNGKVLIAGGSTTGNFAGEWGIDSAEIYDPATGKFAGTGRMEVSRTGHTATLLNDGTVLIAGGDPSNLMNLVTGISIGSYPAPLSSAELFSPASGIFTETGGLVTSRENHTSTRLNDGTVLVTGGFWNGIAAETYQ